MTGPRIDVHHHILPAHYVETVGPGPIGSQGSSGRVPAWSLEGAIGLMDEAGISTAITSVTAPGVATLEAGAAAGLARWCNDYAARMVSDRPSRFGMFTCLPMQGMDTAIAEAVRSFDELGADGVCLLSNYEGRYLGEEAFRPLYEELDRRAAVVFVHPTSPAQLVSAGGLSASTLEFPFDTTRAIASLIFSGVTRDYPSIRWILSHAGGAMPYLAGRVEWLTRNNPSLRERIPEGFARAMEPLFFDCALSADAVHFAALRALVPDSQILFGTDYPFGPAGQMAGTVDALAELGLSAETLGAIDAGNALRLFPRLAALLAPITEAHHG
ncbi:amidohydrolase family protein [Roseomonas sp. KE2513]|uniref:amidohydrolase family protein n=1 Tax=Roseomonas sp. KE2513 TaxID=2479202 RepID=UPI0018DF0AD6|nr:amidohydrolase family protein [Roseomonas sp. KE2513]